MTMGRGRYICPACRSFEGKLIAFKDHLWRFHRDEYDNIIPARCLIDRKTSHLCHPLYYNRKDDDGNHNVDSTNEYLAVFHDYGDNENDDGLLKTVGKKKHLTVVVSS